MTERVRELGESDFDSELLAWARVFVTELSEDKHADIYDLADFTQDQHLALGWVIDEFLTSPNARLRSWSVWVLGALNFMPENSVEIVRALLNDADDGVRLAAAWAAGKLGSIGAALVPDLITAIDDPYAAVHVAALDSLGNLQEAAREAVPTLLRRSKARNECVRFAAIEAMGCIAPRELAVQKRLAEALDDKNTGVRAYAAAGLGWSDTLDNDAIAAVRRRLADRDKDVLLVSAWALGRIAVGQDANVPALLRAMARARWLDVPGFLDDEDARIDMRDDLSQTLNALLPKIEDGELDDFRRRFFAGAFHPDAPLPNWAVEIASDRWYRKIQRARFGHPENRIARERREELVEQAAEKFLARLLKNPTLCLLPKDFRKLPGYIKRHTLSIASSIRRSHERARLRREVLLSFDPVATDMSIDEKVLRREQAAVVRELVDTVLEPVEARIIQSLYEDDLSLAQTAAALNITVSRVRSLKDKALLKLRRGWPLLS